MYTHNKLVIYYIYLKYIKYINILQFFQNKCRILSNENMLLIYAFNIYVYKHTKYKLHFINIWAIYICYAYNIYIFISIIYFY